MIYCTHCRNQLQDDASVCPHCNQPVSAETGSQQPPGGPSDYGLQGKPDRVAPPPPPGYPPGGPPGGGQPTKTSGMAIASLVLGILGFCTGGLLGLVGLILGIVSISKVNKSAGQVGGKGLAIAGIITGSLSLIIGLLMIVAIAVPNFMKMQAKSKQSEAKTNLAAIFTSQTWYWGENNTYADSFDKIGWKPEGQNLYTYYLADDSIPAKKGPVYDLPYDVQTKVEQREFIAVAVGNIDSDDFLDVWTINDEKMLRNVQNDVMNY